MSSSSRFREKSSPVQELERKRRVKRRTNCHLRLCRSYCGKRVLHFGGVNSIWGAVVIDSEGSYSDQTDAIRCAYRTPRACSTPHPSDNSTSTNTCSPNLSSNTTRVLNQGGAQHRLAGQGWADGPVLTALREFGDTNDEAARDAALHMISWIGEPGGSSSAP